MIDPAMPVTTPHIDRASDSSPVMHNPRNEARAAFFKKYKQHAPQGWPYTPAEVKEADELLGITEMPGMGDDVDPKDPRMGDMMGKLALGRLG